MKIGERTCKTILGKSGIGSVDYAVNPYLGCAHGCVYCYARFMGRWGGHANEEWGSFVDVKVNALERLEVEAAKKHVLEEMRADTDRLVERQLRQAEADSVYLGYLYDAWKRALAGEDGYTITQVHIPSSGSRDSEAPQTVWAVLKDNKMV